ncbi:MAG: aldo/keto reductase, partial [Treponema sp.]|nr:aldo/keto reductase [Treponema sp.]
DCSEIEAYGGNAEEKVCSLVHQAYDGGINFFDTAHSTPVCEKRLGKALHGIRKDVLLATKTDARDAKSLMKDLPESLFALETDAIDLYQLENPPFLPVKNGKDGLYDALVSLKKQGTIKHFGIVTENLELAHEVIVSGLYETVQFSFNMISSGLAERLVSLCDDYNVGCIAMQPLNGGVVKNIPLALGFLQQYENVIPVWGAHTQEELGQILYFNDHPPVVDEQFKQEVESIRQFFN